LSWLCLNGKIADLSPLASLRSLRALYLNGYNGKVNKAAVNVDLTPLSGLKELTLLCARCPVNSLEALRGNSSLKMLENCNGAQISDVGPLEDLINSGPTISL
jgi:hypothetical protein